VSLRPFTMPHFEAYCSRIVLDNGSFWKLEDYQAEIVEPILAGVQQTWAILPEGQGKTTLIAGLALYYADYTPLPWIPVAASSRDQASILAEQGYQMVRGSPGMASRFHVFEGYRRIQPIRRNHPNPGNRGIKVYPADVGTGDGVIPTLAICDEGHRWPHLRLYRLWRGKLRKRPGAQIVMISTAGEPGTEFESMRDEIRDKAGKRIKKKHLGAHTRYESSNIVMNEWKVEKAEDIANMAQVKAANPAPWVTRKTLQEDFEAPGVDMGDWRRLKCNIPARSSRAALTEVELDAITVDREIPAGEHIDLGVDVAWKIDTFAIVPYWRGPQYHMVGRPSVLVPPRDGSSLHPDTVKVAFEDVMENWVVDVVVMDMARAEELAHWLEDECRVKVVDWPQGNAQKAIDYEHWVRGMRTKKLRIAQHHTMRSQMLHAVTRSLPGDKKRFDRPSSSRSGRIDDRVIDALDAAAMVHSYSAEPPTKKLALADYRISLVG
jgi:phage terminase large subunit-like protein